VDFAEWEPVYEAILADFGWDRAADERARDLLGATLGADGATPGVDTFDPEALDALFESQPDGRPRDAGRVEFDYYGYTVVVYGDGSVELDDAD